MTPEFSHIHRLDSLPPAGKVTQIVADEGARAALAERFDLKQLNALSAEYQLTKRAKGIEAAGTLNADGAQACVVTGADVPFTMSEPFHLLFTTDDDADEELELNDDDLDTLLIEGGGIDMGEAVAQTLALALNPYPRSPDADTKRSKLGIVSEDDAVTGPFAALAALKEKGSGEPKP